MQVTRGENDRLSGTVRLGDAAESHDFSGTLELMRVFEELVPTHRSATEVKPVGLTGGGFSPPSPSLPPDARTS